MRNVAHIGVGSEWVRITEGALTLFHHLKLIMSHFISKETFLTSSNCQAYFDVKKNMECCSK